MSWLATTWTVEVRDENPLVSTFYPNCEIALEEDEDGKPVMTKDGIIFLMALPKHLAKPKSILSFNWYSEHKNFIEVWESSQWIGNLHLTDARPLE